MNAVVEYQQSPQEISRQERVAERLCERTPAENLKHMVTVSKGRGLGMKIISDTRFRPDGTWYTTFVEAKFLVGASNEKRREVLAAFGEMLTPATPDMIFDWLALLAIKTNKKTASEKDKAAELKVYADELKGFPADVVHYALQAKHYRWWPPVGDIIKICDEQVADRVAVVNKLQALIIRHGRDCDRPVTQDASDEATKKTESDFLAIDEILKNAGFTPKVAWTEDHNIYAKGD